MRSAELTIWLRGDARRGIPIFASSDSDAENGDIERQDPEAERILCTV